MTVGCLGDMVFEVSSDTVKTIQSLTESASAKYATHQRHNNNALTEFVGLDPDKITFDIVFSAYLGVNPQSQINYLWSYIRSGTPVSLVLGATVYGKWRWTIQSFSLKLVYTDKRGTWTHVEASVTLLEYMAQ